MNMVDKIIAINECVQTYMRSNKLDVLTADEGAKLVYQARIIQQSGPRFGYAFRELLRRIWKKFGHEYLY